MLKELQETLKYRYVIYNYVYSSLKQKYRRSFLGFLWSVAAPLLQNLIIGVVFYYLMRFDMPNYLVYLFAGTVIFNIMSAVIVQSPYIMLNNESFIKKIYVPKLVYVLQVILFEITNFVFIMISLLVLGIVFGKLSFSVHYLFLPIPILLSVLFLVGIAIIISITTIYFRDLQHIVPVVMQAAFFLTPVLYPPSIIPAPLQRVISFNPFYYFVEIFRTVVLQNQLPSTTHIVLCAGMAFLMLSAGLAVLDKFDNKIIFKL